MSWAELFRFLNDWQIAIGSILGFFSLACAALFNAHLNRKRDERLLNSEARTLAAAFGYEILINGNTLFESFDNIRTIYPENIDFELLHLIDGNIFTRKIYDENVKNLGKLNSYLAKDIILTYQKFSRIERLIDLSKQEASKNLPPDGRFYTATLEMAIITSIAETKKTLEKLGQYADDVGLSDIEWDLSKRIPKTAINIAADAINTIVDRRAAKRERSSNSSEEP